VPIFRRVVTTRRPRNLWAPKGPSAGATVVFGDCHAIEDEIAPEPDVTVFVLTEALAVEDEVGAADAVDVINSTAHAIEDEVADAAHTVTVWSAAPALEDEIGDADATVVVFSEAAAVEDEIGVGIPLAPGVIYSEPVLATEDEVGIVDAVAVVFSDAPGQEDEVATATPVVVVWCQVHAIENEIADVDEFVPPEPLDIVILTSYLTRTAVLSSAFTRTIVTESDL
jgi:hypothetical protein